MRAKLKQYFSRNKEALGTRTAKVGGYSFLVGVILLAILVAVNVLASMLPSKWTQFDISSNRLYSLTSDSKAVVTNLKKDITIYWIVQAGQEDTTIEKLLDRYKDISDHVSVEKKDPDVYPTFAEKYTSDTVNNNSLVVECGDRYRYIDYNDIYVQDYTDYSTTGTTSTSFDGEGCITSGIDYVTNEDFPQIYLLTGHGEADLSDTFSDEITRENMETQEFSLLNEDEIPDECDCIIINAPTSDISEEEASMLEDYITDGGKILVLSGPQQEEKLTNLKSVLATYNVTVADGVVVDTNRDNYAFSTPYMLMPTLQSSDITTPLIDSNHNAIVPVAEGLQIGDTIDGITVDSLMNTSDDAISKISGYDMQTFDKEDGDISGPFSLGVSISNTASGGKMVWLGSDSLLDDTYNAYSSGANLDLVMNSISWMIGDTNSVSIRSKSMNNTYLTISEGSSAILRACMIGIIPIGYLIYGIDEVVRRRKVRREKTA